MINNTYTKMLNTYQRKNDAMSSLNNDWSSDIENVLEQIRINSVIMSKEHKVKYLYLKGILRYFRVPVILISSIASVSSVGLQPYLDQQTISVITCLLSLSCGIIGSIELFLAIQSRMENELMASKDYYILSIEIFKVLTLDRDNRSMDGKAFLETSYGTYVKLIENSNILDGKIADRLAFIDKNSAKKYEQLAKIDENSNLSKSESSSNFSKNEKGEKGEKSEKNYESSSSDESPLPKKNNAFFKNYIEFFNKTNNKKNDNILPSLSIDDMVSNSLKKNNSKYDINSQQIQDKIISNNEDQLLFTLENPQYVSSNLNINNNIIDNIKDINVNNTNNNLINTLVSKESNDISIDNDIGISGNTLLDLDNI